MIILGIESSCDETAAAVVKDGREVLSSVVYTQIKMHQPYGGVVPEIASRAHVEKISGVVDEALKGLSARFPDVPDARTLLDAVAVTYGPGLASSLIVGLAAAKGLAVALDKPLIAINHIEAHLHTPFIFDFGETPAVADPAAVMPALGLAVSGGHTTWVDMPSYGQYKIIGQTLDDAAGEAFDKAAKRLGLGYPGGPVVDRVAKAFWAGLNGRAPDLIAFPKGHPRPGVSALAGLNADLCTSFSGLKTALLHYVAKTYGTDPAVAIPEADMPRLVASYQEAIVDALADRTARALSSRAYRALVVGGGVSLNSRLRMKLAAVAERAGIPILLAKPKYCGDNAAMIAALAFYRRNLTGLPALATDVMPTLEAGD